MPCAPPIARRSSKARSAEGRRIASASTRRCCSLTVTYSLGSRSNSCDFKGSSARCCSQSRQGQDLQAGPYRPYRVLVARLAEAALALNPEISPQDLAHIGLLGVGGFSKVELWQHTATRTSEQRFDLRLAKGLPLPCLYQSQETGATYALKSIDKGTAGDFSSRL